MLEASRFHISNTNSSESVRFLDGNRMIGMPVHCCSAMVVPQPISEKQHMAHPENIS